MTKRNPAFSFYEGLGWQCHLEGCGRVFHSKDTVRQHIDAEHQPPYRDVYGRDANGEQTPPSKES